MIDDIPNRPLYFYQKDIIAEGVVGVCELMDWQMGVSNVMGVPKTGWFTRENPKLRWMIWGVTSISGNPHMLR